MAMMTIPTTLEALTPERLTQLLGERGNLGGAAVRAVSAEPVGQGVGLLCQLARLTLEYGRPAAEAPRSLVAKLPTGEEQTRQLVSIFRFYEREVRFYQQLASRIALRTPRCYYGDVDPSTGDFVLLLEDLSDRRVGDQLASCSLDEAKLAIGELAKLHATWWNSSQLDQYSWMPVTNDPINKAGVALYPQAWPAFMERVGHAMPEAMRPIGERLTNCIGDILDRFVGGPRTICHGDYRLDNLFFAAAPDHAPLTAIDWQISTRGVGTYDVGYFMTQSLQLDVRREHEMDLLRLYHGTLTENGVTGYSFDECLEHYRWTALFCFAYPVIGGGMGDLSNERGYALATAMMERSAGAILDWKAGELLDGM